MSLKNAKPGDLISASSTVYSATGADRARIVLDFLDGNGVVIESYLGSVVQATAAQRQRSVIEGITVPVGAVNTRVGVENLDDTEEATATEHMINFGPVAMAYMRPPVRSHVETAEDLRYLDGSTIELLKPGEAGANVTETRTSLDTAHIDGIPSEDVITQVNQALNDAALAQEAADREIVAYYQNTAPASGMKFGDIWIDLDADPFTAANAGHRYQNASGGSSGTLAWYKSPNNALIKLYFDAYNAMSEAEQAQATADGKIKTFFATTLGGLPTTGVSEGDLGFVTGEKATYAWTSGAWVVQSPKNVTDGADNTAANTAGRGINLMPYRYTIFSSPDGLPPIAKAGSNGVFAQHEYNEYRDIYARYGTHFLGIAPTVNDTNAFFYFGESTTDFNIPVEGGKSYLFSFFANRHGGWVSGKHMFMRLRYTNGAGGSTDAATKSFSIEQVDQAWPRYAMRVDVPPGVDALVVAPYILANARTTATGEILLDGFQLEELQGNKEEPSAFSLPPPESSDIDALETINGPLHPNADQTAARGTKDLLADDAGLGNRADFGAIIGLPSTVAGYGITDAQKDLGPSNDVGQVLRRDLAGDTYWDDQYGSETNHGARNILPSNHPLTTSWADVGQAIIIDNPGRYVSVLAMASTAGYLPADDVALEKAAASTRVLISFDDGATWGDTSGGEGMAYFDTKNFDRVGFSTASRQRAGTPTGNIRIKLQAIQHEGSETIELYSAATHLQFWVSPRTAYSYTAAALVVTAPDTRPGACARSFESGTTCTASATVKATVIGGVEPISHFWSKVSGSDSITSGATSETCTVSGTHTTADPAAQYQTVVKDTVTDSRSAGEGGPQVVASNNCTVTLSYLRTFEPVSVHVPDQTFGCSTSSGPCIASGQLTRSVTGGDGNYSNAWTKRSGAGSITAGATSASCTVSNTDTNTDVEGVFRCTVTDGRSASGFDDATVTFRHRLFT